MLAVGGLISQHFWTRKKKKIDIFQILIGAQLAYKINPIKFYKEWWNRNTVKISFRKVAVPLVRFSIKDVKMTKNVKKKIRLPYLASYNTREED